MVAVPPVRVGQPGAAAVGRAVPVLDQHRRGQSQGYEEEGGPEVAAPPPRLPPIDLMGRHLPADLVGGGVLVLVCLARFTHDGPIIAG